MQEYIAKHFSFAQEYLESGIQFSNLDYLLQAKQSLVNLWPLVNGDNGSDSGINKSILLEKITRAFTALCVIDPNNSLEYLIKALEYDDKSPVIYNNLGYIYHNKMNDFDKAIHYYKKCFEADPEYITGYLGIIDIYRSLRHSSLELEYAERGIKNCPKSPSLYNLYGLALLSNNKLENIQTIIDTFNTALSLCTSEHLSEKCKILVNLGHVHGSVGDYYKGIELYLEAIKADPTHANSYQNILLNLHYFSNIDVEKNPTFSKLLETFNVEKIKGSSVSDLVLKLHSQICKELYPPQKIVRDFGPRNVIKKINIGYVSSDLFDHAVSFFANVLFTHYNKECFNVHVYSNNIYDIGTVKSLPCTDYTCIKGMPPQQVTDLIINDKIDILIDLSGQTSGNRLDVFNMKPAPILLSYLGYPNDTGLPFMKRISDEFTEKYKPKECTSYSMKRLFLCYTPSNKYEYIQKQKEKNTRHTRGITFGCFAKLQKINSSCIVVWKNILKLVPTSKLVLKSKYFADPKILETWKNKFKPYQNQVVLLKGTKTSQQHLDTFHLLDIHLDTWPYSGTTISTESLYMNVPVVTFSPTPKNENSSVGHVERVTASILSSMNLADSCIACSKAQYVYKAVELAKYIQKNGDLHVHKKFMETEISNHSNFIQEFEHLLTDIYMTDMT
jgi:protein O-GlcNAc transferase